MRQIDYTQDLTGFVMSFDTTANDNSDIDILGAKLGFKRMKGYKQLTTLFQFGETVNGDPI